MTRKKAPRLSDADQTLIGTPTEHGPAGEADVNTASQTSTESADSSWTPAEADRLERATSSMLWAAWADALGFISELTDHPGLARRIGTRPLHDPVAWTRRVGGKFGVPAKLPAGTYSDDTQLRLATARAISGHGFDVEAFARIELTVWPSYALGGGHASRAAAASMTKSQRSWYANFFNGWHNTGGNGAAMRIAPHVWAAHDLNGDAFLSDVLANSVVTHGHPRALVGAVVHACTLAFALQEGTTPTPAQWPDLLERTRKAVALFGVRDELASVWRPTWETTAKTDLTTAWESTIAECETALRNISAATHALAESGGDINTDITTGAYRDLATTLGLFTDETRGSATGTVLATLALSAAFPEDPAAASRLAARTVGTDTDTIATMAASVIAAAHTGTGHPPVVLDSNYLTAEAHRLTQIALDRPTGVFSYPDLLFWVPPQSQLDCVGEVDGVPALAGLSPLGPVGEPIASQNAVWQWAQTDYGASVLVKQRRELRPLPAHNHPVRHDLVGRPSADAPAHGHDDEKPGTQRDTPGNVADNRLRMVLGLNRSAQYRR